MIAKLDCTDLDAAIVAHLTNRAAQFNYLYADSRVTLACQVLAQQHKAANPGLPKWNAKDPWRFLDTRLQALRKKGVISFSRTSGWSLTKQP